MAVPFTINEPGPLAFPITPFHRDGSLDLDAFRDHLRWLLPYRPPALFVGCGTGEFAALDVEEMADLVRAAVEVAGPKTPIFAGVGQGLPLARRFARAASEAGAQGLLVLPPYLVIGEQEGIIAYYRSLATATDLGLILYQRDNVAFEPETVARLAEVPNIIGFKDGLGDMERMQHILNAVGDQLTYFNGMPTAETFQPVYQALNVQHYSSAVFNFVPEVSWAFYEALGKADTRTIQQLLREFFLPLTALRHKVKGYAVALVKAGVEIRRGTARTVRPPLVEVHSHHLSLLQELTERALRMVKMEEEDPAS